MGSPCLPEGIIEDILIRLPTKSIIRFKCVSKSWLNLIKSRNFINRLVIESQESYLAKFYVVQPTPGSDRRFLRSIICLCDEYKETSALLYPEGVDTSPVLNFELPLCNGYRTCLTMVDYCNGIICLTMDSIIIMLANPLLNEVKTLPISPLDISVERLELVGFGFDNVSMDFKVVRILRFQRAEVYSLRTNAWRGLNEFPLITGNSIEGSTFFNGTIHWCARTEYLDWRMLTFDMATEMFEHVEFPQGWNDDGRPYCHDNVPALFVMNQESVAFVSYCNIDYSDHIVNIWTMNKQGNGVAWTKLYSIRPLPELQSPFGFPKKHEFLYVADGGVVMLYDLLNHRRCVVLDESEHWIGLGLCKPSLVSINM